MEEYSDLEFNGDLSFLNENLRASKISLKEETKVEIINKPATNRNKSVTLTPRKSIETMEKFNDTLSNHCANSDEDQGNKRMALEMENQSAPQYYGEKKSQLEEMVLNSGYGPEMFNSLKMELLELEKERIITKYKQELMMFIIKS